MITKPELEALEERLSRAMLNSDVEELNELIADDLLFTAHTGELMDKQADLEAHRSGMISISHLEMSEKRFRIYPDCAIVSVCMEIHGTFGGQPFEGKNRYLRMWGRGDFGWQIIAGQATSMS